MRVERACGRSRRRPGADARPAEAGEQRSGKQERRADAAGERLRRARASRPSAACTRTSLSPTQSASAPRLRRSAIIVSTSRMRGTFESSTGSSVSRQAARMGSAAFLFPAARTRPVSGWPPSITNDSATRSWTSGLEDTAAAMLAPPWTRPVSSAWETLTRYTKSEALLPPRARRRGVDRVVRSPLRRGRGAVGATSRCCTTSTTRSTRPSTSIRRTARRSCARRAGPEVVIEAVLSHATTSGCRATRR